MKPLPAGVVVCALMAMACDADPARSTKIIARPPTSAKTAIATVSPAAPATSAALDHPRPSEPPALDPSSAAGKPANKASRPAREWRPVGCPPPAEASSGPSKMSVTGPCKFEHKGAVACETLPDDLLLTMTRQADKGATMMIFINVERYTGPGTYPDGQMFFGLQDKKNIYRWSSDEVKVIVPEGGESVVLEPTKLEAEPLLINCTGPMNNYQCEGRGDVEAFEKTVISVSGSLKCEGPPKEK